jgi:hypothetical protein
VSRVHGLASTAQGVPFGALAVWQPVATLHESVVQGSPSSHTTALPPVQVPAWQVSPEVQALLSSHGGVPPTAGLEQTPLAGLQVPAV